MNNVGEWNEHKNTIDVSHKTMHVKGWRKEGRLMSVIGTVCGFSGWMYAMFLL